MRVRETPFPSIGLLPTVGTRLRRQATYSAQTNQCSASPCGHGRRGHRGSAAPRGLRRGGTAPAPARPAPPGPAHLQAVGAPQSREVPQRLGRARRVQVELPAKPLHGGAGISGPRAGHGGGERAKTAGRAWPLPPRGRGRGRGRECALGRRWRPAGVTRGHGLPAAARCCRCSRPIPARLREAAPGAAFLRPPSHRALGYAWLRHLPGGLRAPRRPPPHGQEAAAIPGPLPRFPALVVRPRLGPGRGVGSEHFQVPLALERAPADGAPLGALRVRQAAVGTPPFPAGRGAAPATLEGALVTQHPQRCFGDREQGSESACHWRIPEAPPFCWEGVGRRTRSTPGRA